jgi:hypothetical protein
MTIAAFAVEVHSGTGIPFGVGSLSEVLAVAAFAVAGVALIAFAGRLCARLRALPHAARYTSSGR